MALRPRPAIPPELRPRLENARLNLLSLFRAIDQMFLSPDEIPQDLLHDLFELDADYAEALWALDKPPKSLDFNAMLSDTVAALDGLPDAIIHFLKELQPEVQPELKILKDSLLSSLHPLEAYNQVPGRDPKSC